VVSENARSKLRAFWGKILKNNCIFFESILRVERYPYKRYCDKYKCIFIHIPKNAGTSVITLLNGNEKIQQEHNSYWDYLRSDPKKYREYEKFCIVRNPWDRLFSGYQYIRNGGNKGSDKYLSGMLNKQCKNFNDFVMNWLSFDRIYNIKVLNPQFIYIYDSQNERIEIQNILRFESLNDDFHIIKKRLGISQELPTLNQSKIKDYRNVYTEEMVERVAEFYSFDIRLFNYQFEDKNDT